jgi:hypothetical protein
MPAEGHPCAVRTSPTRPLAEASNGSDGSWRTLLAAGEERRRGRGKMGEPDVGQVKRIERGVLLADEGRERTVRRAHVARVERAVVVSIVVVPATRVIGPMVVIITGRTVVHTVMACRLALNAQLALHAAATHRAHHGCRHGTPDREQDSEHEQDPDAGRLHGGKVSRRATHRMAGHAKNNRPCHGDKVKQRPHGLGERFAALTDSASFHCQRRHCRACDAGAGSAAGGRPAQTAYSLKGLDS